MTPDAEDTVTMRPPRRAEIIGSTIGPQHGLPVILQHARKNRVSRYPSIQDRTIVSAVGLNIGLDDRAALAAIGNVEARQPCVATRGVYGGQGLLGSGAIAAIVHDDREAITGQTHGDRRADALTCTCHQNLAFHAPDPAFSRPWARVSSNAATLSGW